MQFVPANVLEILIQNAAICTCPKENEGYCKSLLQNQVKDRIFLRKSVSKVVFIHG
jgi:hypothetical protein